MTIHVRCNLGYPTPEDEVLIFRRADATGQAGALDELAASDAVWLFQSGRSDAAKLVIDFHPEPYGQVADLYDDQDGDGQVSYVLEAGIPRVTEVPRAGVSLRRGARVGGDAEGGDGLLEPLEFTAAEGRVAPGGEPHWSLRVIAPDGWWVRPGGTPNMNLDIEVDAPIMAAWGSETYLPRIRTDGRVDFVIKVRDPDGDGQPDYEIRQAQPEVPESWGIYRTIINVAPHPDSLPITGSILWPYLGRSGRALSYAGGTLPTAPLQDAQGSYGYVRDYNDRFPPIQVDWNLGRIIYVGEFVPSRGGEGNYFIYSISRVGVDDRLDANFENPFAFYDLADDHDGYPELQVRMEYSLPGDVLGPNVRLRHPVQTIRYSWDQDNNRSWDYKLDLLGRHSIDTLVTFGEFAVRTVPYDEYPSWVVDKAWDAAAFVAAERPYWTTEGIYEWGSAGLRDQYVAGADPSADAPAGYDDIPAGLRGEYQPRLGEQARLYLSALDHKLHLVGARAGVWNLDDVFRVRYANLDGDAYLDQWRYTEKTAEGEERTLRELDVVAGQAVYAGEGAVVLKAVPEPPALFETLPPTNHAEWARLGEQLRAHTLDLPPGDLYAMVARFATPEVRIQGATARDFRVADGGFRFVLALEPGFAVQDEAGQGSWLAGLGPGSYLVSYRPGAGYSARPLTPAQLTLAEVAVDPEPAALVPLQLRVAVANQGLEDAHGVRVVVTARGPDGETVQVGEQSLEVPGEGGAEVALDWAPPAGGEWTIAATAEAPGISAQAPPRRLLVAPPPEAAPGALLALQFPTFPAPAVLGLLLAALAGLAGALGRGLWRPAPAAPLPADMADLERD